MSENDQLDDIMDRIRESLDGFGDYSAIRYKHLVVVVHPDYPAVTISMTEVVFSLEPMPSPVVMMERDFYVERPPDPPLEPPPVEDKEEPF